MAQDRATVIEEVYCDLDRVAETLDLMAKAPASCTAGVMELVAQKVRDSARRLEALVS